MINVQNLKVYVHCTAGMGRAPAVVLVYLALFKPDGDYGGSELLMDLPGRIDAYVKRYRVVSVPNMRAVRTVVE